MQLHGDSKTPRNNVFTHQMPRDVKILSEQRNWIKRQSLAPHFIS